MKFNENFSIASPWPDIENEIKKRRKDYTRRTGCFPNEEDIDYPIEISNRIYNRFWDIDIEKSNLFPSILFSHLEEVFFRK